MGKQSHSFELLRSSSSTTEDRLIFSKLYNLYWETLYEYAVKVLLDQDEAMDVVQETFIDLWKQLAEIGKVEEILPYLKTIVKYKAFKSIRQNLKKREYLVSLTNFFQEYHSENPECLTEVKELSRIIDAEIDKLPSMMRKVFIMSRRENLSYKEIASELVISEKTVKKQVSNALKILRSKIADSQVTPLLVVLVLDHYLS